MGLVSSEVILVTQKAGTAKSAVPAFPFSHTSFNPLLPDEPVTDIIDRNPHSGYDSNIIDQPPFRLRFELFLLRLNQSVGITAALINYIHFICLCITEYEEVMS